MSLWQSRAFGRSVSGAPSAWTKHFGKVQSIRTPAGPTAWAGAASAARRRVSISSSLTQAVHPVDKVALELQELPGLGLVKRRSGPRKHDGLLGIERGRDARLERVVLD